MSLGVARYTSLVSGADCLGSVRGYQFVVRERLWMQVVFVLFPL